MPKSENIIHSLLQIWDELPLLAGDQWPSLFPQMKSLIMKIMGTDSIEKIGDLINEILLLIWHYEALRERLSIEIEKLKEREDFRNNQHPEIKSKPMPWHRKEFLEAEVEYTLGLKPVKRFTDIRAPRQIVLGRTGKVKVRLTLDKSHKSNCLRGISAFPKKTMKIILCVHPHDFEVLNGKEQEIKISLRKNTKRAVFKIKATSLGSKKCTIIFSQFGCPTTVIKLEIDVVELLPEKNPEDYEITHRSLVEEGHYVPQPDLKILVLQHEEQKQLQYIFLSRSSDLPFNDRPIFSPILSGGLEKVKTEVYAKLENLIHEPSGSPKPQTVTQRKDTLVSIGEGLYQDLFRLEFWHDYKLIREHIRTIHFHSDEPWVPWEIIRPIDTEAHSHPTKNDTSDFFCQSFQISRWLRGRVHPKEEIVVMDVACVFKRSSQETSKSLVFAQDDFQALSELFGEDRQVYQPSSWDDLENLLSKKQIGVYHFALHGNNPHEEALSHSSTIYLPDDVPLETSHFCGERSKNLREVRPLFFFNVCHAAKMTRGVSRLRGWPAKMIEECHVGAFIGPLWAVNDKHASIFARAFYSALKAKKTIGQAMEKARQETKRSCEESNDSCWAAFALYANPNTEVKFAIQNHDLKA